MNFAMTRKWAGQTAVLVTALLLAACGGGSSTADNPQPQPQAQSCDPANAATQAECGTVFISLTDANGDFLNYTVDVVQLTLETADGRIAMT